MHRSMMLLLLIVLFSGYIHYKHYQEKKSLLAKLVEFEQMIRFKEDQLRHNQQINQRVIAIKVKLENQSMALARRLKNALKNKPCACQPVPTIVADRLYRRAYQIRQSSTDTRKFTQ